MRNLVMTENLCNNKRFVILEELYIRTYCELENPL